MFKASEKKQDRKGKRAMYRAVAVSKEARFKEKIINRLVRVSAQGGGRGRTASQGKITNTCCHYFLGSWSLFSLVPILSPL